MGEGDKQNLGSTDTGIRPNVAALLSYLLWFVSGLIFFLIEKQNRFVRFHALQSIVVFGSIIIAQWVIGFVPVLGALISGLLLLAGVVLTIVLMVKAYQGEMFKIPIAGDFVESKL
jgi:uncharacterized membrane protein